MMEDGKEGSQKSKDHFYTSHLPIARPQRKSRDYNILISGEKYQSLKVSGIVDFGDICVAPRVCDLSIAAAYIVLDNAEPEKMLEAFVSGYHSVYPLNAEEVDLVWRLLRMRLAVSVVNSTLLASKNIDTIMPGFTHLKNAQPISFAPVYYTHLTLPTSDQV